MPYINKNSRKCYDAIIKDAVNVLENNQNHPGHINYLFSSIVWKIFNKNRSYTTGSMLKGVLGDVKDEFNRRKLNVYEDEKIASEGDIE